jgi:hypothetical protein
MPHVSQHRTLTSNQYTYLERILAAAAGKAYLVRDELQDQLDALLDDIAAHPPSALTREREAEVGRLLDAAGSEQDMADELEMLAGWVW